MGGRTEWTATQLDTHDLNERPIEFLWRTATDFGCERPKINRLQLSSFAKLQKIVSYFDVEK